MTKIGLLFPGQGAQKVGMGQELARNFKIASQIFEDADQASCLNISQLCFEGPQDLLNQTEYAQPALLAAGVAISQVLKEQGINPVMMAGLSLGEYTALVSAGALPFDQAIRLVRQRGRLMQQTASDQGAMVAVNGLEAETVNCICQNIGEEVGIANYNCPGQVVISGEKNAVNTAAQAARQQGARIVPLAVSVPSHSLLMKEAAEGLLPLLKEVNWHKALIPVVSNVNARENPVENMPDILSRQLYHPVLWQQSIRYMLTKVSGLIEVGPGTTLAGIIKRIDRSALLGSVNDLASLQQVLERVKS